MDPTACIEEVFDHILNGDYGEARFSLDALNGWVLKGGFLPNFPGQPHPLTHEEYATVLLVLNRIIQDQEEIGNG